MIWLKFALCVAIILFAGMRLARYGDAIAEKTRLGRIWIGLVVVAAVTSMPELVTAVSSAALVGSPYSPDLALGTLLGTCAFNLSILALLDILHRRTPVLSQASLRHIPSAGWGILFAAIVAGGIIAVGRFPVLTLGWVGIPSIIIFVLYLVGIRWIFRHERNHQMLPTQVPPPKYKELSTARVYTGFALAAIAVIAAGIWLSFIGDEIATKMPVFSATFVGSLFLAITTSMPELVVAIAALRLGAIDMAVADILGANMLDLAYIALVDIAYRQGSLLGSVSSGHLVVAAVVAAMSLVVIAGLRSRQERKTFVFMSWYTPVLIGLYIFAAYASFTWG